MVQKAFRRTIDGETELHMLERRHAAELFSLMDGSREHLREWLPWLDENESVKDSESFIDMSLRQFAANEGFQAGIWHQDRLAGVIGFHRIDWTNRATGIGYWLGEEFQGRGLMTKACRALIDYAFDELQLHRIEIRCAVRNVKSRAVPERLRFRNEGTIRDAERLYDRYVDLVVYGMLHPEWRAERSAERSGAGVPQ